VRARRNFWAADLVTLLAEADFAPGLRESAAHVLGPTQVHVVAAQPPRPAQLTHMGWGRRSQVQVVAASCAGTDDGHGRACALDPLGSACNVSGANATCVFTPAAVDVARSGAAEHGYSVVRASGVGQGGLLLARAVGHNLGCTAPAGMAPKPPALPYARGYRHTARPPYFRTVMDDGASCPGEPNGCLNDGLCPPFTSHGASIRQPFCVSRGERLPAAALLRERRPELHVPRGLERRGPAGRGHRGAAGGPRARRLVRRPLRPLWRLF
jgi:hypothetical protein